MSKGIKEKELEKLFEELKVNKSDSFEKLYNNLKDLVYRIAFSIMKNKEDSEDIMQEVFQKIYSLEISKLPSKKYLSWVYSVTKNQCLMSLRKKKDTSNLDNIYEIEDENNEINSLIDKEEYNRLISNLSDKEKEVKFIPGACAINAKNHFATEKVPNPNSSYEEFRDYHGYFEFYDGVNTKEYRADNWILTRKIKDKEVEFCIDASPLVDLAAESIIPVICSYSVESSEYTQDFEISYFQRRDLEIHKLYEDEVSMYSFGGDVNITIEGDMVYSLKDALEQNVITLKDIMKQAQIDKKYGVCLSSGIYQDGGSIEYYYNDYTILKYNKLDGTKDIVIGFKGSIINLVDLEKAVDKTK